MSGTIAPTSIDQPASIANRSHDSRYIPEIDGLRAIAVGSVMLFHLSASFLPGGFTGVDVFFVISGYVVSGSLGREAGESFLAMLRHFYSRRIIRIVPALLVCLLVSVAATILFIPLSWLSNINTKTALYAFFGASNFVLLGADHYFSPRPEFNPFTQTWSLAVEEQFYLFFPFIFFVWSRFGNRKGIIGVAANSLLAGVSILSFGFLWWVSRKSPDAGFYLLPSRFWELGVGALLFQLQSSGRRRIVPAAGMSFELTAGVALVLLAMMLADPQAFPFPWALPAVIGTALIIAGIPMGGSPSRSPVAWILRSPPMVYIGKISYPLYLWHWPVYTLFRWTVGLRGPTSMALAVGLTALIAYLSYTLVERPIRLGRWIRTQPKSLTIAGGLAAIVLSWATAQLAFMYQYQLSMSVVMKDNLIWYPYSAPHQGDTDGCTVEWHIESLDGASVNVGHRRCAEPTRTPTPAPRRLFVVGDSHTMAYSPLLTLLAGQQGVEVRAYYACPFASLLSPSTPDCLRLAQASITDIIQRAMPGDVVFLATLRMQRLGDQWGPYTAAQIAEVTVSAQAAAERRLAYNEAVDLIRPFSENGLHVIIDAPMPGFRAPPFRCSDWFNAGNPTCEGGLAVSREELFGYRKPIMESLAALSSMYPNLVVWDPFPVLCPQDPCRAAAAAGPLFFDGDHLTNFGNQLLYPHFLSVLRHVWAAEK